VTFSPTAAPTLPSCWPTNESDRLPWSACIPNLPVGEFCVEACTGQSVPIGSLHCVQIAGERELVGGTRCVMAAEEEALDVIGVDKVWFSLTVWLTANASSMDIEAILRQAFTESLGIIEEGIVSFDIKQVGINSSRRLIARSLTENSGTIPHEVSVETMVPVALNTSQLQDNIKLLSVRLSPVDDDASSVLAAYGLPPWRVVVNEMGIFRDTVLSTEVSPAFGGIKDAREAPSPLPPAESSARVVIVAFAMAALVCVIFVVAIPLVCIVRRRRKPSKDQEQQADAAEATYSPRPGKSDANPVKDRGGEEVVVKGVVPHSFPVPAPLDHCGTPPSQSSKKASPASPSAEDNRDHPNLLSPTTPGARGTVASERIPTAEDTAVWEQHAAEQTLIAVRLAAEQQVPSEAYADRDLQSEGSVEGRPVLSRVPSRMSLGTVETATSFNPPMEYGREEWREYIPVPHGAIDADWVVPMDLTAHELLDSHVMPGDGFLDALPHGLSGDEMRGSEVDEDGSSDEEFRPAELRFDIGHDPEYGNDHTYHPSMGHFFADLGTSAPHMIELPDAGSERNSDQASSFRDEEQAHFDDEHDYHSEIEDIPDDIGLDEERPHESTIQSVNPIWML